MLEIKLRILIAGCIVSIIGAILLILKGFSYIFLGLLVAGFFLITIGIILRIKKPKIVETD